MWADYTHNITNTLLLPDFCTLRRLCLCTVGTSFISRYKQPKNNSFRDSWMNCYFIGKYTKYLCPKYNFLLILKERPRRELKSAPFTTNIESRIQIKFLNNSSAIYFFKNLSRILLTLLSSSCNRGLWLQLFNFADQKVGGRRFFRLGWIYEKNSVRNCRFLVLAIM